jgi:two-component system chemotaxis response regulator CheY
MNPIQSRLLLVGSSAPLRRQMRELLSELKVTQMDEASEVLTAFTLHQKNPYDAIVCEWDLPRVPGIELVRGIRRSSCQRRTSMVLVTAQLIGPRTVEALQAGANGILEFPFDPHRTLEKFRRVLCHLPERSRWTEMRVSDAWSPSTP